MCGIFCSIQDSSICTNEYIEELTNKVSGLLHHRGPDSMNYNIITCPNNKTLVMLHTRLHIMGDSTPQPLMDESNTISLIINGEIFNWRDLEKELDYKCSKSDCEIIIPLYKKYVQQSTDFKTFFSKINGQFSFILYDSTINYLFVSRDHIGITPLYCGYDENKIAFSSELKCLTMCTSVDKTSFASSVKLFYPRTYLYTNLDDCGYTVLLDRSIPYLNYYELESEREDYKNLETIHKDLKYKLETSVKLQLEDLLNENSPEFGVLLSGGLDSSLVSSIVSKLTDKKIKTFSIGMSVNSTDLIASRKVAKFLDTDHYEFYFTADEGLNSIRDVIWYTETYDTTTIRASTAMYLLTKKIKEKFPNLKVLFSGELSDEMMSYLYGGNAPSEKAFQMETIKLVSDVHIFDCLRANKTCMANSIEVRVPFTDPDFVRYMLRMPVKYKIFGKLNNNKTMEKQILRDSFNVNDNTGKRYLPKDILYRRKEAFSDGVSNHENTEENWIDSLINHYDLKYGIISFLIKKDKYTHNQPLTKEQLYYRETFCELFNKNSHTNTSEFTVNFWEPKWCGYSTDPSARKHIHEQFEIGSFERIDMSPLMSLDTSVYKTSKKSKKLLNLSHII
jgi:asparagine synthase (glutamine-hydrolysing)